MRLIAINEERAVFDKADNIPAANAINKKNRWRAASKLTRANTLTPWIDFLSSVVAAPADALSPFYGAIFDEDYKYMLDLRKKLNPYGTELSNNVFMSSRCLKNGIRYLDADLYEELYKATRESLLFEVNLTNIRAIQSSLCHLAELAAIAQGEELSHCDSLSVSGREATVSCPLRRGQTTAFGLFTLPQKFFDLQPLDASAKLNEGSIHISVDDESEIEVALREACGNLAATLMTNYEHVSSLRYSNESRYAFLQTVDEQNALGGWFEHEESQEFNFFEHQLLLGGCDCVVKGLSRLCPVCHRPFFTSRADKDADNTCSGVCRNKKSN